MVEFPKDFYWGAAGSAYQVEGNNTNSDWWDWEKKAGLKELCGRASDHYQRYKEDFDLAKLLHHNCHRLSIEWSRIQPREGEFDSREIEHYADVISSLRQRGIEPIVTLHHFTNPMWFTRMGGWETKNSSIYFSRYVEKIIQALCEQVKYWITINEPMIYVYFSYIIGIWPPQEKTIFKSKRVMDNMVIAHVKAYKLIHKIYKTRGLPPASVSVAQNMQAFLPCSPTLKNKLALYIRDRMFNFEFIRQAVRHKSLDFIGLNYYTRGLVDVRSWKLENLLLDFCKSNHHPLKKNYLGWDIYPQGLYELLLRLKKYNLPVLISENGICTDDDFLRWEFISGHLKKVHAAMAKGVEVLGYIYWSLLDNFEWDKGFGPRFGLIEVDYQTYKRSIRESARKFALVCKSGKIET